MFQYLVMVCMGSSITTAREIIARLRKGLYCGGFGVEFMNINDPVKKKWLQERLETLPDRSVPLLRIKST